MFEFGAPKEAHPMYGAILEFEALRLAGKPDQAKKHIDAVVSRLDSSKWPFPIVRYLRGEIDEAALIAVATDNDKQTEVHCYLGYQDLINGDKVKAQEHFRWVAEHGPKTFIETELARAELERMGG
jgi:lipoprotein NlpI